MTPKASDVMQHQVLTVSPDDPLYVVQRLFYEEGIHGAPVVDQFGGVVGVITSTDILRAASEDREVAPAAGTYFRGDLDFSHIGWAAAPDDFRERLKDATVSDHMTEELIRVSPDATVPTIARTLREHGVHRVLVMDGDKLCGIVCPIDLIALLEEDG